MRINNFVTSTHTGFRIPTIKNSDSCCTSKNLIYLLTCNNCKIQYVGETKNMLKNRMSQHKSTIKNQKHDTILARHFKNPRTNCRDFSIDILDNIESENTKIRREKELFWIKMMRTAYPMGLNDHILGYGNISINSNPFILNKNPYEGFRITIKNKKHGTRKKLTSYNISATEMISLFDRLQLSELCKLLKRIKKSTLDSIIDYIINDIDFKQKSKFLKQQFYAAFSSHFFQKVTEIKNKTNIHRCKIPFINKSLEFVNIKRILNKPEILTILKESSKKEPLRTGIIFTYENPISMKILSYNKFLKNLDQTEINNRLRESCICDSLEYKKFTDIKTGHIMTGDLNIVKNENLQKILEKGTKFRIQTTDDPRKIKETINESLSKHVTFLAKQYKLNENNKNKIITIFHRWLENLYINPTKNFTYGEKEISNDIKHLQKNFVIVPVDKASNNYSIICKKLYLKFLEKELFTNHLDPTCATYSKYTIETQEQILFRHKRATESYARRNSSLKIIETPCLPLIYGIPKMHKKEPKLRFITGASSSSIKSISIELQNILTFIKQHFTRYCRAIEGRSNISLNWIIKSSHELLQSLDNQWHPHFTQLFTADFESLFTNLPHKTVVEAITYVLNTCFKNAGPNIHYLVKIGRSFRYEQQPTTSTVSYHILEIIKLLEYILNNSYAQYGQTIFQQINGIPQGNSASPLIADLTLMAMEVKFVLAHQNDFSKRNFFAARYMDDIIFIGKDLNKILEHTKNMYHSSLTLSKTNQSPTNCDFLDLNITLENGKLSTKLYNKTDDFPFKVLKYPHFNSNIHSNIICNTIAGEVVRIERSCSKTADFILRMTDLIKTLQKNNFSINFIKNQIFKNIMRRKTIRYKYKMDNIDNITQFLQKFH